MLNKCMFIDALDESVIRPCVRGGEVWPLNEW